MIPEGFTKIDASRFDLSKRLVLYKGQNGTIYFYVNRKSRFIMKDTILLLERAEKIKSATGENPTLWIESPICSKSKNALFEASITVLENCSNK